MQHVTVNGIRVDDTFAEAFGMRATALIITAHSERWARQVAAYKGPVLLRFAQEMNGRWYPWSESTNGNHRGEFVRAWRHVHAIFDRAGSVALQPPPNSSPG